MKNLVRWAIRNTPAMNVVMIATLIIGMAGLLSMRREVFPEFDLETVLVRVPYPGASPEEIEEGICQKVEEAVRSIKGIKKQTSVAGEGLGTVVLELDPSTDVEKCLNEVRSEVDRISTFPQLAEDPDVEQLTVRSAAIKIAVLGPDVEGIEAELRLREMAEDVRAELIRLGTVSQASIKGAKSYQLDVEISEDVLREYGLSLRMVADRIRRENLELPGGTIKTESQDVLVKGDDKGVVGARIAEIPLVTTETGTVLTVGDLGVVLDEFADTTSITRVNGKPAMVIATERTADEDLLEITESVRKYVADSDLPEGYSLVLYEDRSRDVRDRMDLLVRNGTQGLLLVLLVLSLFLDSRLAFWVAMGIPVSVLGAGAVLYMTGQTLNMLTMFAFLMALGIVVDDAIVIGENIYTHRQMGKSPLRAAVDGTVEVVPSVAASVTTTVIFFMPLFFVAGVMGKFIAVMPLAMIAMLVISLVESTFILPCHLAHGEHKQPEPVAVREWRRVAKWPPAATWTVGLLWVAVATVVAFFAGPFQVAGTVFNWLSRWMNAALDWFSVNVYQRLLRFGLTNVPLVICGSLVLLMLAVAMVTGGHVKQVAFPSLDGRSIAANVTFPDGTPAPVSAAAVERISAGLDAVDRHIRETYGRSYFTIVQRSVGYGERSEGGPGMAAETSGGNLGGVLAELVGPEEREMRSDEIANMWRDEVGPIAGVETMTFGSQSMGPGGKAIEFKLLADADDTAALEDAVERCKEKLETYPGVYDVADDSSPGKWEYRLSVKDGARALDVPLADLAETVRAGYFGEEVMRLQRGRHEVKLMVRYPTEDRRSLADFENIRVRTGNGAERPLTEVANVHVARGPSEINRVDQLRSITITAAVDESKANATEIIADMRASFMPPLLEEFPNVSERWEGQAEQTRESMQSLMVGCVIALFAMYVLLVLAFRSYLQPLIVLSIVPFGIVGAILGHWIMVLPFTLFSIFGLVALTGVVVNDSIVLIDFVNQRMSEGLPTNEAILEAGRRRLRPVLLTSVTTIAGLLPLLMERSFQAQLLIPMAVSLAFGLMVATVLVLFLVPVFYRIYAGVTDGGAHAKHRLEKLEREFEGGHAVAPTRDEPESTTPSHTIDEPSHEPRPVAPPPRVPAEPRVPVPQMRPPDTP